MSNGAFSARTKGCSIEGCVKPFYGRGWCKPHYNQMIKRTPGMTGRICDIDGCGATHYGKGYCRKHWERANNHGDPHHVGAVRGATITERLAAYSRPVGDCIEWVGYRDKDGYGSIAINGESLRASRVAYMEAHGQIPEGLVVRHKCDNPPCIKAEHLELGTHRDNTHDAIARGRWAVGERNGDARLTNAEVTEIMRARGQGKSADQLAADFEVGRSTIYRILRGQSWSSVTGVQRG